jgi:hypothetical protein
MVQGVVVNPAVRSTVRDYRSLDGAWSLRIDPDDEGRAAGWYGSPIAGDTTVPVPGCIQQLDALARTYPAVDEAQALAANARYTASALSRNGYRGTFWQERTIHVPAEWSGRCVRLNFGGIGPACRVFLNGVEVGSHDFPMVSVGWEVGDVLRCGEENRVTVAVLDPEPDPNAPHKTDGLMGGMRAFGNLWSGAYRSVELEALHPLHVLRADVVPHIDAGVARVTVQVRNSGNTAAVVTPVVSVTEWQGAEEIGRVTAPPLSVDADGLATAEVEVPMPGARTWSPAEPALHVARIALTADGTTVDAVPQRFGYFSLVPEGERLLLNGTPFMVRGVGQEYCSPSISPLVDRAVLRQRLAVLKDMGFNFKRWHTHPVTPEAAEVAEEVGFLFTSEVPIVSNFNRVVPFGRGLEMFVEHVRQTRNYAALAGYCLGNEGVQITKGSSEEIAALERLRREAPHKLMLFTWGSQSLNTGGLDPATPNDVVSPSLWSTVSFVWSYDGLTSIPWDRLRDVIRGGKPCVLHEYGKFGVWPDPAQQTIYPEGWCVPRHYTRLQQAAIKAGLGPYLDRVIVNSRKLAASCNRIVMEEARRQPGMDGYVVWAAHHLGIGATGFADGMGGNPICDPTYLRESCNSPVALLIDRSFRGRTLVAGTALSVGLHCSNFGECAVEDGVCAWRVVDDDGGELAQGRIEGVAVPVGENQYIGTASQGDGIAVARPQRCRMEAELYQKGRTIGANSWDFWVFPESRVGAPRSVAFLLADETLCAAFAQRFPEATDLAAGDTRTELDDAMCDRIGATKPRVIVTDLCVPLAWQRVCTDQPVNLLLLSPTVYDERLHATAMPAGGGFAAGDCYDRIRFYTPFRPWDQANLGTVILESPLLDAMPHDGWCDLQFFDMIQGSLPFRAQAIAQQLQALFGERREDVPVTHTIIGAGKVRYDAELRTYMSEATDGQRRAVCCAFQLMKDPAGEFLLRTLLNDLNAP